MARTTRSSAAALHNDKDKAPPSSSPPPARSKPPNIKKRKRNSSTLDDDQPSPKQARTDKDDNDNDNDNEQSGAQNSRAPDFPFVGDAPLNPVDASKILDILEMIDTQGLLDRVFPLQAESSESSPQSYSFRNLLQDSSQHPLSVLRSAVRHLFPISSHSRSKRSNPATQQLQFCNLALSLLEQASCRSVSIPPDVERIFSVEDTESNADGAADETALSTLDSVAPPRKTKYALVQHLSSGEWWTSLNSDLTSLLNGARKLNDLKTAHAQLVAVLPSPSTPMSNDVPKLGSYNSKKVLSSTYPHQRRISTGSFLDYGAYSTFAPTFDQEGACVGRMQMGEVLWAREQRRRQRGSRGRFEAQEGDITMTEIAESLPQEDTPEHIDPQLGEPSQVAEALDGLIPPDDIEQVKSALQDEALEQAVQELLRRNEKAILRLEELQYARLTGENGKESKASEGTEEWDTAQSIMDSLTILASLRPHTSHEDGQSIIPSLPVIRKLGRTLPLEQMPGWRGTLPPTNANALRDDSTVKAKAYSSTTGTSALPVPTATPPLTSTPTSSTTPYPYSYTGYSSYRPGAYSTYKGAQPSTLYNTPYTQSNYYQSSTQQPYPSYASWYSYASSSTANSGRGTPQMTNATPTSAYSTALALAQQQRTGMVVANTVTSPIASDATSALAPLLPAHLRSAVAAVNGTTALPSTTYGAYGQPPVTSLVTE